MLQAFSVLALGGLFAGIASAAPASCVGAKYLDRATGACKPCGSRTAKTCTSATIATSCVRNYYLAAAGQCVTSRGKCDKCFLPTFKTCSSSRSTAATSCDTPYFFNATSPATFNNTPAEGDTAAPNGKRALSSGGTCVTSTQCGRAFYPDSSTRTCAPCGEHVARCDEHGALACKFTYFLSDRKCVETCPEGQRPDQEDGTCVLASESCPEGQFYDSFSDSCVQTCRDTAIVQEGTTTILPALYGDTETMRCVPCRGGNAYRCNPNTGYARNCYASFAGPRGQEPLESDETSTTCTMEQVCASYPLAEPLKRFILPGEFAVALPEEDQFIGYCPIQQK
ncbi:hypothetical protein JCM11251_007176 [Rhodosporidiobolus azoricus]